MDYREHAITTMAHMFRTLPEQTIESFKEGANRAQFRPAWGANPDTQELTLGFVAPDGTYYALFATSVDDVETTMAEYKRAMAMMEEEKAKKADDLPNVDAEILDLIRSNCGCEYHSARRQHPSNG